MSRHTLIRRHRAVWLGVGIFCCLFLLIVTLPALSHLQRLPHNQGTEKFVEVTPPTEASSLPLTEVESALKTNFATNTTPSHPEEAQEISYIEITDSCGPHFEGECLNAQSGPGTTYPAVAKLRNNIVLKIDGVFKDSNGAPWYKVVFDEWLRYPERVGGDWYVAAAYVTPLYDITPPVTETSTATTTKKIVVDRSEQKLYAYDGDTLFMEEPVSTGLTLTPTPRGVFTIFRKTPSRYMQGPLPYLASDQYYDLPGVPWNLYFTEQGAVIHGAYWHNSFGKQYSHGCVNLLPETAERLYAWANIGTKVIVQD